MSDPIRMQAGGGATDFQQRLLESAKDERLSPALTQRLQRALGLSQSGAAASFVTAKAGMIAWVSAGILAVGLGGGMLGAWIVARPAAPARTLTPAPSLGRQVPPETAAPPEARATDGMAARPPTTHLAMRRPATAGPGDLRAEIGLIDAARDALGARAPARALDILRRYVARYPDGTFAPEAVALRVEALDSAGEHGEAQSLARQFIAAHPDSPLAERIDRFGNRGDATPSGHLRRGAR